MATENINEAGRVPEGAPDAQGGSDNAFAGGVGEAMPEGVAEAMEDAGEAGARPAAQGDAAAPAATQGGQPDGEAAVADLSASDVTDAGEAGEHPDTALAAQRLDELQRLNAEYVNYRMRVERDRESERAATIGTVVESFLPLLDDLHLAREHGDLAEGPMARIAEKLEGILAKNGIEQFGAVGEVFDPTVHEALMHNQEPAPEGATETVVVRVMQPGVRIGERIVRAARVGVSDPA